MIKQQAYCFIIYTCLIIYDLASLRPDFACFDIIVGLLLYAYIIRRH
jgi:hypothetical protein